MLKVKKHFGVAVLCTFLMLPVSYAQVTSCYSIVASACVPSIAPFQAPNDHTVQSDFIRHADGKKDAINFICPVVNTTSHASFSSADSFGWGHMVLVGKDPDQLGTDSEIGLDLGFVGEGGNHSIFMQLSSNIATPTAPDVYKISIDPVHDFSFAERSYYLKLRLYRSTTTPIPVINAVRLCPGPAPD